MPLDHIYVNFLHVKYIVYQLVFSVFINRSALRKTCSGRSQVKVRGWTWSFMTTHPLGLMVVTLPEDHNDIKCEFNISMSDCRRTQQSISEVISSITYFR